MTSDLVFSKLAELRNEKAHPSAVPKSRYVGLEHIEQNTLSLLGWGMSGDVDSQKQRFYKGDILFGKLRPYFRKVVIAPFDGICSTDIWVVNSVLETDRDFLFYWMASGEFISSATNAAEGTRMPRAKWDWVSRFELPYMHPEYRNRCGRTLRVLDEKISHNRSLSQTLEGIAQRIFQSWFIDFDPVKAKMAGEKPVGMDDATAALFPDSMEHSELGSVPKGWAVKPLFDFKLDIESGARPKGGVKGIEDGVPSIGAESINGLGVFNHFKTKYVSEEFFQKMNKGKPQDFDVLLYKDGGKPGEFKPRVGMFGLGFPFARYAINEHVFLLRSRELGPAFLYFWIRMERTLDILRNRGIKAAIPGINQQDVGTIPVLWSNPDLISKFNELCMPYLELILTLASESLELARIRDSLLPRLISGDFQIPEEMLGA